MASFVTKGNQLRPPHIRLLGEKLAAAVWGHGSKRLIVTMPPRHGKSQLCSWWLPAWFLSMFPEKQVILASYEADFAATWGRRVRNTLAEMNSWITNDVEVAGDSSAASRWEIAGFGGGMMTAGVGGPLTGKGAHLLIIDDPIKNSEEANSEVMREKMDDWWRTTAFTRLEPGGVCVIIHTRWHEDDMIGRLVSREPEGWEIINFPAVAESNDILGRRIGEALWPERYDVDALRLIREGANGKAGVGSAVWSALYQQNPVPLEGGTFKRAWFEKRWRPSDREGFIHYAGADYPISAMNKFQTTDLAVSLKSDADYTVDSVWGIFPCKPPLIFLLETKIERMEAPELEPQFIGSMRKFKTKWVTIESVAFQLSIVQQLRRKGVPVKALERDKDKVSRAQNATPYCEAGRVVLPAYGPCQSLMERQLFGFPKGAHDDFVDSLTDAVMYLDQYGDVLDVAPNTAISEAFAQASPERRSNEAPDAFAKGDSNGFWS